MKAESLAKQPSVLGVVKKEGSSKQVFTAEHQMVLLICCEGLVPRVLKSTHWKNFVHALNPKFAFPSADKFTRLLIPAEVAHVREKQEALLKTQRNMTMTFDGGSIRKRQSTYTIHVTTADRDVYFLSGEDGTRQKHNIAWVCSILDKVRSNSYCQHLLTRLQWVKQLGPHRFAAVGSDSTALTKAGRRELTAKYPTILNFGDPCHHLNLTIKEITELPEFKDVH